MSRDSKKSEVLYRNPLSQMKMDLRRRNEMSEGLIDEEETESVVHCERVSSGTTGESYPVPKTTCGNFRIHKEEGSRLE